MTTHFPIHLGIDRDGAEVTLDFADSWHTAAQGMSRSGKSVLAYAVLSQLAHRPDVIVCGLDPTGVLLGPWVDHPGSEYRAIKTASMQDHAEVVGRLVREMDSRISGLLSERTDKLETFDANTALLVVVLEEYPGVLAAAKDDDDTNGRKPAERVLPKIKARVRRLIQEGAKVGIRVFLMAQRMDAEIIGGAERSNLGNRISLRVDNGDAVRMLHPQADPVWVEAVTKARAGRALLDRPGKPSQLIRVDYLEYSGYFARVERGLGLK